MKLTLKIALFCVVLTFAFCVGFSWRDVRMGEGPSKAAFSRLLSGKLDDGKTPTQLFRDNYSLILARFHRPIAPEKLKYAGMEGLFGALGDPHTVFMEPQVAENFSIETKGNYAGIGARLGADPLGARVGTVFKNGPADKAGLEPADIVTRVGNVDIAGMATEEIVKHIRGGEGTPVTLTVMRKGEAKPLKITINRAIVVVPTSEGSILANTDIGYITIDQFSGTTPEQFDMALFDVLQRKPRGLVLDVRGNPGGLLDTAVAMLSRFVDDKTVVTMKQKGGGRSISSTPAGRLAGYTGPIVVLIDGDSASASEIFAGALRDYKRATLVGEHTYGKASVQTVVLLKDMSTAKITVSKYFLPSGEDISRKVDEDGGYVSGGVKPHHVVQRGPLDRFSPGDPERDPQLAKAIELIHQKTGG
jgi:carboxyl-terminal processing protease